jgi:uncharacterized protein (DUF433 family)
MQGEPFSRNADILNGVTVFTGTRVPVRTLVDYLEEGESIDSFLSDFPTVPRSAVLAWLTAAERALSATLN